MTARADRRDHGDVKKWFKECSPAPVRSGVSWVFSFSSLAYHHFLKGRGLGRRASVAFSHAFIDPSGACEDFSKAVAAFESVASLLLRQMSRNERSTRGAQLELSQ